MDTFKIAKVDYYSQRNNKFEPFRTCFPTSQAMTINYCLSTIKKKPKDLGCPEGVQLEDFITEIMNGDEMKKWTKDNVSRLGDWVLNVNPRYNAYAEEYLFNKLMNPFGFKATFKDSVTFDEYCDYLEGTKLPQIAFGRFPLLLTGGGGHICCAVGFNRVNRTLILMDPYGDASSKYENPQGIYVEYKVADYFYRDVKKQTLWIQNVTKVK